MVRKQGHYLGTEIEGKWWRRYTKVPFFARGMGEFLYDEKSFYFWRYLTKQPLVIPLRLVTEVRVGHWHCGKWMWGITIVKLIWENNGFLLSSGFVLSRETSESNQVIEDLKHRLSFSEIQSTTLGEDDRLFGGYVTSACHFLR